MIDIYAKPGTKVMFFAERIIRSSDKELTDEYLENRKTYTIKKIEVESFFTYIFLKEVSGNIPFNSVLFDEI